MPGRMCLLNEKQREEEPLITPDSTPSQSTLLSRHRSQVIKQSWKHTHTLNPGLAFPTPEAWADKPGTRLLPGLPSPGPAVGHALFSSGFLWPPATASTGTGHKVSGLLLLGLPHITAASSLTAVHGCLAASCRSLVMIFHGLLCLCF